MSPHIVVAENPDAMAALAADHVCARLSAAISERGHAHLVLTGGSSPHKLYADLRRQPWRSSVEWTKVVLWMGDDRYVPASDPNSNAGVAMRLLCGDGPRSDEPLPVTAEGVRFFPIDESLSRADGAEWAAQRYAADIAAALHDDSPTFDVVLLGLGSDGHILSVFPGSRALASGMPLAMTIPTPSHIEPHLPRLTLNPSIVAGAQAVVLLAQGDGKANIVASVLNEPHDSRRFPAQLATLENATWFLDSAAAAGIGPGVPR